MIWECILPFTKPSDKAFITRSSTCNEETKINFVFWAGPEQSLQCIYFRHWIVHYDTDYPWTIQKGGRGGGGSKRRGPIGV